jgi:hypothetical protein
MSSSVEDISLRRAFERADLAYSVELARVYKERASTMRYLPAQHTDEALIAARKARDAAMDAWHETGIPQ